MNPLVAELDEGRKLQRSKEHMTQRWFSQAIFKDADLDEAAMEEDLSTVNADGRGAAAGDTELPHIGVLKAAKLGSRQNPPWEAG